MNKLLLGFTVGVVAGAFALKKMEKSKMPEKAFKTMQKKIKE